MLPLTGSSSATSPDALRQSLLGGFAHLGLTPREIVLNGDTLAALDHLSVDLSGATLKLPPPNIRPRAALAGAVQTQSLAWHAAPLLAGGEPVEMHLTAKTATLREHEADGVPRLLLLETAADGALSLELERASLERLALAAARLAAGRAGAEITELHFDLQADGGRSLRLHSEITAKFGFVKAKLQLTGRAELDDTLTLHLSNLTVEGSGMAAGLATKFLRPHLERLEREPISLSALPLGEIQLRDVQLYAGEKIRLEAQFGSATTPASA